MKRTLTEQQKKTLSVLAIVIFVLLSAALAWFVGRPMVRFARQPEQFRAWVDGHGAWAGTALCLLGAVLGSVTVFALVRRWGRGLVEVFFPADKLEKLQFLLHTSPKRTALFWLIFTVPGTPKDLLCYFAGLTDLPWGTWLLIATVGRLPSIVTSTVGGSALGEQNYRAAVIAFALALAVAGVGYVIYRAVCRRHGQKPDNTKTDG